MGAADTGEDGSARPRGAGRRPCQRERSRKGSPWIGAIDLDRQGDSFLAKLASYASLITMSTSSKRHQVNILQAKNQLSQLIKQAQAGQEVVIANRGEPVARLVGLHGGNGPRSEAGNGQTLLDWLAQHPLPAYARRSAEEIDAALEEERAAWD